MVRMGGYVWTGSISPIGSPATSTQACAANGGVRTPRRQQTDRRRKAHHSTIVSDRSRHATRAGSHRLTWSSASSWVVTSGAVASWLAQRGQQPEHALDAVKADETQRDGHGRQHAGLDVIMRSSRGHSCVICNRRDVAAVLSRAHSMLPRLGFGQGFPLWPITDVVPEWEFRGELAVCVTLRVCRGLDSVNLLVDEAGWQASVWARCWYPGARQRCTEKQPGGHDLGGAAGTREVASDDHSLAGAFNECPEAFAVRAARCLLGFQAFEWPTSRSTAPPRCHLR